MKSNYNMAMDILDKEALELKMKLNKFGYRVGQLTKSEEEEERATAIRYEEVTKLMAMIEEAMD